MLIKRKHSGSKSLRPMYQVSQFVSLLSIIAWAAFNGLGSTSANAYDTSIFHAEAVDFSIPANVQSELSGYDIPMSVQIDAFNRRFDLELYADNDFMKDMDMSDTAGIALYRGHVLGVDNSWVRVTQVNGATTGVIHDGTELFMIGRVANLIDSVSPALFEELDASGANSAMFRAEDVVTNAMCGTGPSRSRVAPEGETLGNVVKNFDHMNNGFAAPDRSITLKTVYDESLMQFASSNGSTAADQIIAQMYIVDGIYNNQLGIKILQTPAVKYSDTDTGDISSSDFVTQFQEFSIDSGNGEGLAHLFTGRNMDRGATAGVAFRIGGVCSTEGVAISTLGQLRAVPVGALIVAHEIGHNLGAPHDAEPESACEATPPGFLMQPRVTGGGPVFSGCSLTQIANNIAIEGSCLQPYVDTGNRAPVLEPIGLQEIFLGDSIDITLSATDPDNDELRFFAPSMPDGLSLSEDGRITGTPLVDRSYNLIVIVSDGEAADSEQVTWRVFDPDKVQVFTDTTFVQVSESDGTASIPVKLSRASEQPITVVAYTEEFTANQGQDYYGFGSEIVFAPGETQKTVSVEILDDAEAELNESLYVVIAAPQGAQVYNPDFTEVSINDDDADLGAPAAFSVKSTTILENAGSAPITVTLSKPILEQASVRVATTSGDARSGADFYGLSATITFEPAETIKTIPVQILDDSEVEGDEAFNLRIYNPSDNATVGTATGTITIGDDDGESATFSVSSSTVSEDAGVAEVTVSLSSALSDEAGVSFATASGSGTKGVDYYGVFSKLIFSPGETSKKVAVQILNDAEREENEVINVRLFNPTSNTTLATANGTIIIEDDDG